MEMPQISSGSAWTIDGIIISEKNNDQELVQICSDGAGGAIIVWRDHISETDYDIYAQKVNSTGDIQWNINGILIGLMADEFSVPQICSDGEGGAIITWGGYAQKVNSSGSVMWTANSTIISTLSGGKWYPMICSDGAGGAIITWRNFIYGSDHDIYAQKVNSSGDIQWTSTGIAVCSANNSQWSPELCSDGNGGAIITWEDYRSGRYADIYTQKIDSSGNIQWSTNGVAICTENSSQNFPQICSDGSGGAIITWDDLRDQNSNIYAQMIDSSGNIEWTNNGTAICIQNNDQLYSQLCSDRAGGAIITWQDNRSGLYWDIYAQKIDSSGNILWTANGVAICTENNSQYFPQICSDGAGGAIITWEDQRVQYRYDIYAQKIDSAGDIQWLVDGIGMTSQKFANLHKQTYPKICSNGEGSAIIVWQDYTIHRLYEDIYAQSTNYVIKRLKKKGITISFGNYYFMFTILSVISLIIIKKRRIFYKFK